MEQEQDQTPEVLACVLCGTKKGSYKFYRGRKSKDLRLCLDCLKDVTKSVTDEQLADMTVAQLKRHMEVRDELASTYKDTFVATKKFCVGKGRTVPILEVDEEHGLWALPQAPMPLAQSISSIVDVEVALSADDLSESGEMVEELFEGASVKELIPFLSTVLKWLYKSKHTDLAPIPEGKIVSYLKMVLTLDDQESGLGKAEVDLLPFWVSLPSRVNAGYDCAYEVIEFLKKQASDAYKQRKTSRRRLDLTCNERLFALVASGLVTDDEAETLRYYLERIPEQDEAGGPSFAYGFVKAVVDAVCENLISGEAVPDIKTLHTTGIETFLGAFYRYAPRLSVSDVVYIMDNTKIQSGKGGLLFAQGCFAVDGFRQNAGDEAEPRQPIAYDDLLFVSAGAEKGHLVLNYKDGRRTEVNGGKYAHFIFAAVNCILLLRRVSD